MLSVSKMLVNPKNPRNLSLLLTNTQWARDQRWHSDPPLRSQHAEAWGTQPEGQQRKPALGSTLFSPRPLSSYLQTRPRKIRKAVMLGDTANANWSELAYRFYEGLTYIHSATLVLSSNKWQKSHRRAAHQAWTKATAQSLLADILSSPVRPWKTHITPGEDVMGEKVRYMRGPTWSHLQFRTLQILFNKNPGLFTI